MTKRRQEKQAKVSTVALEPMTWKEVLKEHEDELLDALRDLQKEVLNENRKERKQALEEAVEDWSQKYPGKMITLDKIAELDQEIRAEILEEADEGIRDRMVAIQQAILEDKGLSVV